MQAQRLTREEEYALFSQIWQKEPEAASARERLIFDKVGQLRTLLFRFAQTSAVTDLEDWQQEAYLIVTEALDRVPQHAKNPGAYLYTTAYHALLGKLPGKPTMSLDAPLPGCDDFSLLDTLADPGDRPPGPAQPERIQALYEAYCRLPVHQQRALRNHYRLDFTPSGSCLQRTVKRQKSLKRSTLESRRFSALKNLRRDQALLKALGVQ